MSEGRVHPAAILIWLFQDLRKAALGFLPVLTLGSWGIAVAGVMLLLVVIQAVIKYFVFSYRIDGDTLIVAGGFLFRWRRVIPLARVQSVEIVQGLVHRLFDVTELRVEAIGGQESEAAIPALAPATAEAMRARLLVGGASDLGEEAGPAGVPPLVSLTPKRLVVAGLTGGRVAVIAAILGSLQQFETRLDRSIDSLGQWLAPAGSRAVFIVVALVLVFLLVTFAISIVATLAVYWGFTLRLEQSRLLIERGLLETRSSSIPLHRIQAITVHENPIRRLMKLASCTVTVAGFESRGQDKQERSMLLPISPRADAFSLVLAVLGLEIREELLERLPARALAKRVTLGVPFAASAVAAGAILGSGWTLAGIAGGVALLAGIFAAWRMAGYLTQEDQVIVRRGILVRKTTVVPMRNVQHLVLVRSPLQLAFGLGSVRLGVPKAAQDLADGSEEETRRRFEFLAARLNAP